MPSLVSVTVTANIDPLATKLAEAELLAKASAARIADTLNNIKIGGNVSLGALLARGIAGGGGGGAAAAGGVLPFLPGAAGAAGPGALAGGAVGILAIGPIIGQALGSVLIGAMGAALTGMAIMGAMKAQKVQQVFDDLKRHASQDLIDIGKPFVPVMESIFKTARTVVDGLTPVFKGAATMLAGPFGSFMNSLIGAFRQPAVAQSIQAVAKAFGAILTAVSPQLSADVGQIAKAITGLANAIGNNPHIFATFGRAITDVITWAIDLLTILTKVANWIESHWTGLWSAAASQLLEFAKIGVEAFKMIADISLSAFGVILTGAAKAFGWIPGVGGQLRNASKSFDEWKSGVDKTFQGAIQDITNWQNRLYQMPKVVKLQGDISDLTGKLNTAEQELKNPTLSATQRAKIEANIDQLEAAIAKAKAELAAINGTTATTYVVTQAIRASQAAGIGNAPPHAHGGIIGAAGGGGRSGLTLVGEYGAELVRLPVGSQVFSNPDTQRMLAQGVGMGGGGGGMVLEVVGGDSEFEQFMATFIKRYVRIKGGGNVQSAFGRR